jgi:integrase
MASVIKRGDAWRAMIRARGQSISRTFDTQAQARLWADREEARIRGGATAAEVAQVPSGLSVASLFNRYAREISPDKRGARWETIRLRKLALDPAFQCVATELDGAAVAGWRDKRLKLVSASTVNRELNLISAVLTLAIKEWRLPMAISPVRQIQRPKSDRARTRRVSDAERTAIIEQLGWDGVSAPVTINQQIAWVFAFALETMARQGEILSLRWKYVFEKHCHLPMTKNDTARDVPLSSQARALIGLLKRGYSEARVIPVNPGTFGGYFRQAVKDAGISGLHFHDTRREAITRMAPKLSVIELARSSGHSGTKSLMIYYNPAVEDLADKLG